MKRLFLESVRPLSYSQMRERREKIQYEKTKFYVNRLPLDVYIRDRSGLLTQIKAKTGGSAFPLDRFFICEYISCTPDILNSFDQQARQTPKSMQQYAHQAVIQKWSAEPPARERYSVEAYTQLLLSDLKDNDGIVYLEDHDLLVMYGLTKEEMDRIHHPYSLSGYVTRSFENIRQTNPYISKGDFTFNIRIVDNADVFGSRWILIDDKPFIIVASKDNEVTDGIYVTYSDNTLNGKGPQILLADRIEFGESGKLPYYKLYESRQEAMAARRSTQVDEAAARLNELESKVTASQNALRKAQQDSENLEREAQLRKEKFEQEMEKLQRDQEKLKREHNIFIQRQVSEEIAMRRKNTTELIKCVPAILSTVAVAMTLFKKKKE